MTFLELQNDVKRTRRLLRKRRQQNSDSAVKTESDKALEILYKKAKTAADQVVSHYIDDLGELIEEKIAVTFGEDVKKQNAKQESDNLFTENFARQENDILRKRIGHLQSENEALKKQLAEVISKFTRGGRKGYGDDMIQKVRFARDNGETWRGLAKRLGISPTTAQKLYRK